jgi:Methyltransferase domain
MSLLNRPELLELLACPSCHGELVERAAALRCACGRDFPIVRGVPVFTSCGRAVEVRAEDHASNQADPCLLAAFEACERPWLHLGAGATDVRLPGSVELESAIFRNTDVVGDAARMPFRGESIGGLLALNVFEHLAEPEAAAGEIDRVLVGGAPIVIQTAFLQPLHADPGHFYNTTEEGLRRWFSRFDIESVTVPSNFNPVFALAWMASDLLFWSTPDVRERFARVTLGELARIWADPAARGGPVWDDFMSLPDRLTRILAAGFELRATRRRTPVLASVPVATASLFATM